MTENFITIFTYTSIDFLVNKKFTIQNDRNDDELRTFTNLVSGSFATYQGFEISHDKVKVKVNKQGQQYVGVVV